MSTATAATSSTPPASTPSPRFTPPVRFDNAAEWLHALGDIPPSRIIMDPLPGTATEADLLTFVERDKRLCELVDGTLVEKSMRFDESQIAVRLIMALGAFVYPRRLGVISGEAGTLRMASGRVRLPDVAFVSADDLPDRKIPREPIPRLSPTLAVEVLSASNTKREIDQKLKEYFESGTQLAWIVDPASKTVRVYERPDSPTRTLTITDMLDGGTVLAGFTMPVRDIFETPTF